MGDKNYSLQVELLLQILPIIAEHKQFALKGGTAINLFIRDMPRLSVDIDLTFLPILDREKTLTAINDDLIKIEERIRNSIATCKVHRIQNSVSKKVEGLVASTPKAQVKIEPNTVFRGTVFPCQRVSLCEIAKNEFSADTTIQMVSLADVFGGKICAMLDRQHPRDIFDVKLLLENEGITLEIRQAFLVYLSTHNRPMHELLNPTLCDIKPLFKNEFKGMSSIVVSCEELEVARSRAIETIRRELTDSEREFLLSLKSGQPNWALLPIQGLEELPAIKWKLQNIAQMERRKHAKQLENLRECLVKL